MLNHCVEQWNDGKQAKFADRKTYLPSRWCTRRDWDRHEVAPQPFCSEVSMADLVPVHIRHGDKNGFLSQWLDISPVAPRVMRHWQASYTAIVVVFRGL